ncbi:hypothetical protein FB45DRAFT_920733 [Roridomyces roridus]|uniref:Glycosyltransferase n=1 Tax=Roridomyces roridus TaxID=1738132 RepID=A0AAD7FME4_9AGAR|nr:hypothetical protein FB45DRAFT_920733 [Roridomyces roridus]
MTTHHIAALLTPAWGQTTSYISTATALLNKDPDVFITIVQHNVMVAQMETELATEGRVYDKQRLRIVGVGPKDKVPGYIEGLEQMVAGWIVTLEELTSAEVWPKPRTVHLDWNLGSGGDVVKVTKQILGSDCKTILFWSTGALVMSSNGTDKLTGAVVKFPGGLELYDHEVHPYAVGPSRLMGAAVVDAHRFAKTVDGLITTTSSCLEAGGVAYCRALYKNRGQELFAIGMQTHPLCWQVDVEVTPSDERIRAFLDRAVREYGKKSVLYISFGSIYFPIATRDHIEAMVETLLELEAPFPFIFALGAKVATLPAELVERVNTSGKGLICDSWVEQRAILQHGGVGWFLTHGGWNSLTESLTQGIPLIVWPASGEQAINAAFVSTGPQPVAIQLFQIRTGAQLGPSLHTDAVITGSVEDARIEFKATFTDARGSKGKELQRNAAGMASALRADHAGEAAEELGRLARF